MGARIKKSAEERLFELLGSPRYQPLNKVELAKRLQMPLEERSMFRRLLTHLETQGKITRIRKDRYVLPEEADLMVGVLQVNPEGFGYLLNESADGLGDLYISAENQGTAMHRDRVVARIIRDRVPPERGRRRRANREGRVIKILVSERTGLSSARCSARKISTTLCRMNRRWCTTFMSRCIPVRPLPEVNDKVVVRLEPWEHRHLNPEGDIIEVLGPAKKPGIDILSIIRKV